MISGGTEIIVPLAGLIDVDKECARLRDEVAELEKQITSREGRLNNEKYVAKAPPQVVATDRAMLEEMKTKRGQLVEKVRSLCGDLTLGSAGVRRLVRVSGRAARRAGRQVATTSRESHARLGRDQREGAVRRVSIRRSRQRPREWAERRCQLGFFSFRRATAPRKRRGIAAASPCGQRMVFATTRRIA